MSTQTAHGWVPDDTLANRLVLVRRQVGLSQRAAAERAGLTFGEWQGMEDGRSVRGLDVKVRQVSMALGVDRDWLMWGGGGGSELGRPGTLTREDAASESKCALPSGERSPLAA